MGIKVPAGNLMLENVQITYRNFAGNEGQFNPAGVRGFSVILEDIEQAQALEADGWKVKYSKPRQDGSDPAFPAYMPVFVKYHPRLQPPKVVMLTSRGKTNMDEEAIDVLDFMALQKSDMILRPYHWKQPTGAEGVKNMLSSLYVTIQEDELELRYADVPEIGVSPNQRMIDAGDPFNTPGDDIIDAEVIGEGRYALEQGRGF